MDTSGFSSRGSGLFAPHTPRIVNPLTTMFDSRCYIIRARIITDILVLEGGVCVGEIAASRGLVEAHQRPVLQGLIRTTRVGSCGVPALLLVPINPTS
jgi:hypothetical protein